MTVNGLSKDFKKVDPDQEGFSKVCQTKEEVAEILEKLQDAEMGPEDAEPRITIVGQGAHLEIRKEGSDLNLYDKVNLNIQGLKVTPHSVLGSMDGNSSQEAEDSENSQKISSSGLDRKAIGILIGIGLVASIIVQAALFLSQNPDPIQSVRPVLITGSSEVAQLKAETVGTYVGSTGNLNFGITLKADGSYEFLDISQSDEGSLQSAPFETGTYDFGKLQGSPVVLFQDQSLAEISEEGLEFYGYALRRISPEADG